MSQLPGSSSDCENSHRNKIYWIMLGLACAICKSVRFFHMYLISSMNLTFGCYSYWHRTIQNIWCGSTKCPSPVFILKKKTDHDTFTCSRVSVKTIPRTNSVCILSPYLGEITSVYLWVCGGVVVISWLADVIMYMSCYDRKPDIFLNEHAVIRGQGLFTQPLMRPISPSLHSHLIAAFHLLA